MYNIGDIVKIKEDFMEHRYYLFDEGGADPGVIDDMYKYAGLIARVRNVHKRAPIPYYVLENAGCWDWDERWLEPVKIISIDEEAQMEVFQCV